MVLCNALGLSCRVMGLARNNVWRSMHLESKRFLSASHALLKGKNFDQLWLYCFNSFNRNRFFSIDFRTIIYTEARVGTRWRWNRNRGNFKLCSGKCWLFSCYHRQTMYVDDDQWKCSCCEYSDRDWCHSQFSLTDFVEYVTTNDIKGQN